MGKREIMPYRMEGCPYCGWVRKALADFAYLAVDVPRGPAQRTELFKVSQQRGVPTLSALA